MSNGGRFFSNNRFLEDSHSSSFEKVQMLSILLMGAKIFLNTEMLKTTFFQKWQSLSTYSKASLRYFSAIEDAIFSVGHTASSSSVEAHGWQQQHYFKRNHSRTPSLPAPLLPQLANGSQFTGRKAGGEPGRLPLFRVCGWPRQCWTWAASSLSQ